MGSAALAPRGPLSGPAGIGGDTGPHRGSSQPAGGGGGLAAAGLVQFDASGPGRPHSWTKTHATATSSAPAAFVGRPAADWCGAPLRGGPPERRWSGDRVVGAARAPNRGSRELRRVERAGVRCASKVYASTHLLACRLGCGCVCAVQREVAQVRCTRDRKKSIHERRIKII